MGVLMLGIALLGESVLLLILTSVLWHQVIAVIGLVWAVGMIALWFWINRRADI